MTTTNRWKFRQAQSLYGGTALPTQFHIALGTNVTPPTVDSNTMSDVSEIAAGNGYTSGGQVLTRDSTGFPTISEDDVNNWARAVIRVFSFTASGGTLPASGGAINWVLITGPGAVVADREIYHFFQTAAPVSLASGQTWEVTGAEIRITDP